METLKLNKNKTGLINNKKVIGSIKSNNENEFLLQDSSGVVFYYNGFTEERANTNINLFEESMDLYNNTIKNISLCPLYVSEENILNKYKFYQRYINNITNFDFESAKSYFWQEKMFDIDTIIDEDYMQLKENGHTTFSFENQYTKLYVMLQIDLCILEIDTYEDYKKIDSNQVIDYIEKKFKIGQYSLLDVQKEVVKYVLIEIYGEARFNEYTIKIEKRKAELWNRDK